MFTGLIADLGRIEDVERSGDGVRLIVSSSMAADLGEGDSIAVNGVCLTAVGVDPQRFGAFVMGETLRRSSLAGLCAGARVNLELPVQPQSRLGGHIVQGHVDGVGTVAEVRDAGEWRVVRVDADPELLRYVVEKGSITVDGVSLTVSGLGHDWFEVSLIPTTLEMTTLGQAKVGAHVNLEVDVIAKYVERLLTGDSPSA
jgi:riboflavin synthase